MKSTITAIAATLLATTAFAAKAKPVAQPAMHPLPAIGVLPAMMIFEAKKNPNFRPAKPYGKNTRTSI